MIVGPIFISFASPFFVCVAIVILTLIYFLYARRKKHNEIPTIKGFLLNKMSTKMRLVKILTFILSSAAILIFISASLDPRLAKYETNSTQSRRILILFDGSGSMTVGFDDSNSPLPSYEKTRMGRAGIFVRKLVEKREGDAFSLIFFDSNSYISRDFTTDGKQIIEVLQPERLASASLENLSEALRLKEDAEAKGTQSEKGLFFAKDFILSHNGYRGDEILVYVGDLELQNYGLDRKVPVILQKFKDEYQIKTYAVAITSDYTKITDEERRQLSSQKLGLFSGTSVPVYKIEDVNSIEEISNLIAKDIPTATLHKTVLDQKSLALYFLMAGFVFIAFAIVVSEKFPKIP